MDLQEAASSTSQHSRVGRITRNRHPGPRKRSIPNRLRRFWPTPASVRSCRPAIRESCDSRWRTWF